MHDICPRASRCVLVRYGDGAAYLAVRRAIVLGQVDTYVLKPVLEPEDRLYPVVGEILGRWTRASRPRVQGHIFTGRHVVRGEASTPAWSDEREPYMLETSLPGVFATGDVRHRSPRGVAAAVADGAIAIRSVLEYLGSE